MTRNFNYSNLNHEENTIFFGLNLIYHFISTVSILVFKLSLGKYLISASFTFTKTLNIKVQLSIPLI